MHKCNDACINLIKLILIWACNLAGIRLLPDGCRAIPSGHFDFDPDIARSFSGRDRVHKAVILQYILNWIDTNERAGRNQKEGRTWTYNSGRDWATSIDLWNRETVEKHIRDLELCGHLVSKPMNAHKGDQTKWYAAADKDSNEGSQMPLWVDEKTPETGVKAHTDSSIPLAAFTFPAPALAATPTPARARKPKPQNVGVVAEFPPPLKSGDLPEHAPEVPDRRPHGEAPDGGDAAHAPTPVSATPPSWTQIFTRIDGEIGAWLESDYDRLKAWCEYAAGAKLGGGYVRQAMREPGCWPQQVKRQSIYTSGQYGSFVMS